MKKIDIVIFLFSITLISIFLIMFLNLKESSYSLYEVYYKNDLLYSSNVETDVIIEINAEKNKVEIKGNKVLSIDYQFNDDFINIVEVKNKEIKMIFATCTNKTCMNSVINNKLNLPIVCTSGIIVRLKKVDTTIYV